MKVNNFIKASSLALTVLVGTVSCKKEVDSTTNQQLVAMKSVQAAQAFAVTLEPKGGSIVPTMEQMYVIGNV